MSHPQTVEAIIINHWDYGEKDQIVSFLTDHSGKMQGIAKGAKASRKRFGASLDLFSHVTLTYRERKNSTLVFIEQAQPRELFFKIRQNYDSILLAMGLLELVQKLYRDHERGSSAFEILFRGLSQLELGRGREVFWRNLLDHLEVSGVSPQFQECIRCKTNLGEAVSSQENPELKEGGFDMTGGGLVCSLCANAALKLISVRPSVKEWMFHKKENLSHEDEKNLEEILHKHLLNQLDLDLEWGRFWMEGHLT